MQRLITLATVIVSGSFFTIAYASNLDSTSSTPAAPNPVMTPDQFKSAVENYSKQTKSNIAAQVDQQTAYRPNTPASSGSSPSGQAGSSTQGPNSAASPDQSQGSGSGQRQTPTSTLKPSAPTTNQGEAPSSQYYNGFGSGQPAQNSNTSGGSQNKSNGNWNVGY